MEEEKVAPEQKVAPFLTIQEAAKYLNVSRSTIDRLTAEGAIAYYKIGKKSKRFLIEDLDAYIARQKIECTIILEGKNPGDKPVIYRRQKKMVLIESKKGKVVEVEV